MKLNQLLGLFTLVGVLMMMPRRAAARDITIETDAMRIRVEHDHRPMINQKVDGPLYQWNIKPNDFYPRLRIDQYRPGLACRQTRRRHQTNQRRSGSQIYHRSTVITSVCQ